MFAEELIDQSELLGNVVTATFAYELHTAAGDPVSVTDGQATIANCHEVKSCGE